MGRVWAVWLIDGTRCGIRLSSVAGAVSTVGRTNNLTSDSSRLVLLSVQGHVFRRCLPGGSDEF